MFQLEKLLRPDMTHCAVAGVSKKRVFETAAALICQAHGELAENEVYSNLLGREKLGSTALGDGIAIPHCRISNCDEAIVSLITLADGVDFDAPDGEPVDILFVLLVPEEAQQEHLNILAGLAQLLNEARFCKLLRDATDDEQLHQAAVAYTP